MLCGHFDVYTTALASDINQLLAIQEEIANIHGITVM